MKKSLFWLLVIALAVALYRMPRMVESSIPSIYYVTPCYKTYERIVACSGVIQPDSVREIYLQSPAVPQRINVRIGDRVEEGQFLASFDLFQSLETDSGTLAVLSEYVTRVGEPQSDHVDLAAVAALYGLSATVSGGITDYGDLSQLLAMVQEQQVSDVRSHVLEKEQTQIYAPISGVVSGLAIRENTPALPGIALLTISDDTAYKVLASVPESDIARVMEGNGVKVRCAGNAGRVYDGVVTKIYPTAHKVLRGTATETVVDVEIALTDSDSSLKSGFTAKVEILGGSDNSLITVPYEAIRQDENNDEYVYVYEAGKIKKNPVLTGQELTNEVEILQGLSTESVVVFNPGDIVREGAIINLRGRANVD